MEASSSTQMALTLALEDMPHHPTAPVEALGEDVLELAQLPWDLGFGVCRKEVIGVVHHDSGIADHPSCSTTASAKLLTSVVNSGRHE